MDCYKITRIDCECGREAMIIGAFGCCEWCARQHHIHEPKDDGICDVGGGPCE